MSSRLVIEITCDQPDCPTLPILGGDQAAEAGWYLGADGEYCPDHRHTCQPAQPVVDSCTAKVWLDGAYETTCGLTLDEGACRRHGRCPLCGGHGMNRAPCARCGKQADPPRPCRHCGRTSHGFACTALLVEAC